MILADDHGCSNYAATLAAEQPMPSPQVKSSHAMSIQDDRAEDADPEPDAFISSERRVLTEGACAAGETETNHAHRKRLHNTKKAIH